MVEDIQASNCKTLLKARFDISEGIIFIGEKLQIILNLDLKIKPRTQKSPFFFNQYNT